MALFAFTAPIPPGKRAQWDDFMAELAGPRHDDFTASRRKHGVHERTFLQETPMGDFVIVTLEGDNAAGALGAFAQGNDDFTQWFVQQVQEVHGFDLRQPPETSPHLVLDSEA